MTDLARVDGTRVCHRWMSTVARIRIEYGRPRAGVLPLTSDGSCEYICQRVFFFCVDSIQLKHLPLSNMDPGAAAEPQVKV